MIPSEKQPQTRRWADGVGRPTQGGSQDDVLHYRRWRLVTPYTAPAAKQPPDISTQTVLVPMKAACQDNSKSRPSNHKRRKANPIIGPHSRSEAKSRGGSARYPRLLKPTENTLAGHSTHLPCCWVCPLIPNDLSDLRPRLVGPHHVCNLPSPNTPRKTSRTMSRKKTRKAALWRFAK